MSVKRLLNKILNKPETADPLSAGERLAPSRAEETVSKSARLSLEKTSRWNGVAKRGRVEATEALATEQTKMRQAVRNSSEKRWVFTVNRGADQGRQFVGATPEIKIGRQPDNHIQLRDPKVSRFHAVILQKGARLFIDDLDSTNGTFVNDKPVSRKQPLSPGDLIKVGQTVIEVSREN